MTRQLTFTLLSFGMAAAFVGCQSMETPKFLMTEKAKAQAAERETPARMAVIWSEAALSNPGQPAIRGFGGRVYFYNDRGETIAAKGQFTVYAFDDSTQEEAGRAPEKKFAFTAEQFQQHQGKSTLGPSYSIWLPWDQQGGEQREISLLPIFTSTSGKVVAGEQSTNVLPGKKRHPDDVPAYSLQGRGEEAKQVGHWESAEERDRGGPKQRTVTEMRTSTIPLSSTLAKQIALAPPQRIVPVPNAENGNQVSATDDATAKNAGSTLTPAPWAPPDPRLTRYVRPRSQALGEPLVPPNRERGLIQPSPGGSRFSPPPQNSPNPGVETGESLPGGSAPAQSTRGY